MAACAGAEPAGADADVVEVLGAVGVGLGPFASEGGAESALKSQWADASSRCEDLMGESIGMSYPVDVSILAFC